MNCTIVSIIPKTLRVNQAKRNGWMVVAGKENCREPKEKKERKKMIIETRRQWTKWRVLVIYRRRLARQCRRCQTISVLFQYFRKRIWETLSLSYSNIQWIRMIMRLALARLRSECRQGDDSRSAGAASPASVAASNWKLNFNGGYWIRTV